MEALRALASQIDAFKRKLNGKQYPVAIVGFDSTESLLAETDVEEIHIVPAFQGGKSPFVAIGIGALLIGASIVFAPALGVMVAGALFSTGVALALGGVMQMLSPAPVTDSPTRSNKDSKYLGAPGNTVAIGTRIPIIYGRQKVGGHYLSFDIQAKDVVG
jgi:predicted phage tail protein